MHKISVNQNCWLQANPVVQLHASLFSLSFVMELFNILQAKNNTIVVKDYKAHNEGQFGKQILVIYFKGQSKYTYIIRHVGLDPLEISTDGECYFLAFQSSFSTKWPPGTPEQHEGKLEISHEREEPGEISPFHLWKFIVGPNSLPEVRENTCLTEKNQQSR